MKGIPMLKITPALKQAQFFVKHNSPAILTAIGVTGTLTTAFLTGHAAFKAAAVLREAEEWTTDTHDEGDPLPLSEAFKKTWTLYIPAAGTAIATVACVIGASHISSRRTAALAAAYGISEKAFAEYKAAVVERLGKTEEDKIKQASVQNRVNENPPSAEVWITDDSKVLFLESMTGRYFRSNMEAVRKAVNDLNESLINYNYASLSDWFHLLQLDPTDMGEELGWQNDKLLDIDIKAVMAGSEPCLAIEYNSAPFPNFYRVH